MLSGGRSARPAQREFRRERRKEKRWRAQPDVTVRRGGGRYRCAPGRALTSQSTMPRSRTIRITNKPPAGNHNRHLPIPPKVRRGAPGAAEMIRRCAQAEPNINGHAGMAAGRYLGCARCEEGEDKPRLSNVSRRRGPERPTRASQAARSARTTQQVQHEPPAQPIGELTARPRVSKEKTRSSASTIGPAGRSKAAEANVELRAAVNRRSRVQTGDPQVTLSRSRCCETAR